MRGTFKFATVRGIPLRVHVSLLFVLPLLAFGFANAFRTSAKLADIPPEQISGSPLLWGLLVATALFASVLAHELAHSLYATSRGGRVRGITLLIFGGVSELSRAPEGARREAVMALVGPVTSLAIGALFWVLHGLVPAGAFTLKFALFYLCALNVGLGLFNLLPAFPMDGGRILRALLVPRLGKSTATQVAAAVGKAFAFVFGILGLLTVNVLLLLIAYFVYLGAGAELRSTLLRELLEPLRVKDMMREHVTVISPELSVAELSDRMVREQKLAYVVEQQGTPSGVVTLEQVQAVPLQRRAMVPVRDIAAQAPVLSPAEPAEKVIEMLSETEASLVLVMEGSTLVGAVGAEELGRAIALAQLRAGVFTANVRLTARARGRI